MVESLIWALFLIYFLWRLESNYKEWVKKQSPLADIQYRELKELIEKLQSHVNNLVINKDYDS